MTEQEPVVPIRNMHDQPRYDPQEESAFFKDGRTMRSPPEGTVAVEMEVDLSVQTGRTPEDDGWLLYVPRSVMPSGQSGRTAFLERGQERYNISCAPCHGASGHGDGMVARRAVQLGAAALSPPTLHDERIRTMPDGQLFATISNGIRKMPAYRHAISVRDRWAIASYVRALQLSQASRATARLARPPRETDAREVVQ
ncbi:MAG: cytochrome c [Myxococcota bacterium]